MSLRNHNQKETIKWNHTFEYTKTLYDIYKLYKQTRLYISKYQGIQIMEHFT